ncbi:MULTISPECIES: MerR family transcriptional regulator [Sphingobium]|uniref:Transcriptional regulator n=1 Tax=Sphingobium baderi TaxID=1332080 RepID=A0A0S3EUA5_9SPHN|nr:MULTISPECIES: MerR family transcriptional regulator [Sphingobium]ALR19006.1 transcriptional regulator [Sphingobium baderi]
MEKAEGAFLTISELAGELDLPQHILRYWETRFPQLRPLQRAGNRRYYRPADVALVRRINQLLNVEGFTVRGAQKALADGNGASSPKSQPSQPGTDLLRRLESIRTTLAQALGE